MGIFPRRNIKATYKLFSPLANHLAQVLGREVQLVTARDFPSFWEGVRHRRYDIVHFNQYHYIISNKLYGYKVIVKNQEFGQSKIAGTIIVRKDSGITHIKDLKDKTILFGGGPRAMQAYIGATWLLRQGGLKPGDYIERIALNPPNALMSTYHKQADAAGTGDVVTRLDIVTRAIDVSQMKYLARTPLMSHLPWAVRDDLDNELTSNIQTTLVNLKGNDLEGQLILDSAKLSALEIASDEDYDQARKIIRDLYGDDYGINKFK